ncbi:MAG: 30S ribosomal protein S12 methylthiotransferase RimO [Planctomycetaceae bacterium]|nr:30S ribosomal protein S12 methylthiotransferase RimO [Planctomycetaceae bacterium]
MMKTKESSDNQVSVGFISLGCPKNMVDSEKMLALIAEAGFVIDYDTENADVVVINTCGFIQPAIDEAIETISHTLSHKRKGNVKKVVVAGCLAERMQEKLFEQLPQIDAVVCLGARDEIVNVIKNLDSRLRGNDTGSQAAKLYKSPEDWATKIQLDSDRLLITSGHWAYLRISEGCDRNCAFCTIPSIKGKFRSKPLDEIVKEAKQLADSGIVEISVIAQDCTCWGRDLGEKDGLMKVISELEKIEKLKWIRLMYLNPTGISDELIETIAKSKKILHYIDMPIQHINNDILKAMHRPDTKEKIAALIEKIRKNISDVVLRTTVIVGFPGETEQHFNELLDFIKVTKFDALGCFAFWPEPGTKAAELKGKIQQKIKDKRVEKLMLAQQEIVFTKNNALEGQTIECLIDENEEGQTAIGRYYGQAPHIDSVCLIQNCNQPAGSFIEVKVTDFKDYDLVAYGVEPKP